MRAKTLIISLLFLISFSTYAQEMIGMFKDGPYWGFINLKGEVVVKPKYTFCRDYRSGMAKVGKLVFIDEKGVKLKAKIRYQDAAQFHNGLLAVKANAKWGFINRFGELVVEAKYKKVTDFNAGYAIAVVKKVPVIIDKKGAEIEIKTSGKLNSFKPFSEGLAIVEINALFGFVNEKGEMAIEHQFLSVGYFKEGLAWARTNSGKIGYINKIGEWVIEPIFLGASNFGGEMARVKMRGGWKYINLKGEILSTKNKGIDVFKRPTESCALVRSYGLWGYLDASGGWLLKPQYEGATVFKNGYARVRKDGKWGLIDRKGSWVLAPTYDNLKSFSYLISEY